MQAVVQCVQSAGIAVDGAVVGEMQGGLLKRVGVCLDHLPCAPAHSRPWGAACSRHGRTPMKSIVTTRRALVAGLALSMLLSGTARAEVSDSEGVGYGVGAALCSVVYGPAKIVYALLGSIVGAGAWAVTGGDAEIATPIFESALYGDYVVTPDVLRGERPLEFVGRPSEAAASAQPGATPSDGF